jgi:hypothetical protein
MAARSAGAAGGKLRRSDFLNPASLDTRRDWIAAFYQGA